MSTKSTSSVMHVLSMPNGVIYLEDNEHMRGSGTRWRSRRDNKIKAPVSGYNRTAHNERVKESYRLRSDRHNTNK